MDGIDWIEMNEIIMSILNINSRTNDYKFSFISHRKKWCYCLDVDVSTIYVFLICIDVTLICHLVIIPKPMMLAN